MMMPGRKYSGGSGYRYGFNGKENDQDIAPSVQDYGLRIYDARLSRFLSVDPLTYSYPWYTPYQFAGNSPIANIDLDGGEPKPSTTGTEEGQKDNTSEYRMRWKGGKHGRWVNDVKVSKDWFYHKGGMATLKGPTKEGWYSSEDYFNLLKSTNATAALAKELNLFNCTCSTPINASTEELSKFIGTGLGENAEKYIIAAAEALASERNFSVIGITYASGFNVEDMLGVGLIFKAGAKILGTYAAKTVAGRSINFLRKELTVGGTKNIGTLGGMVEGEGYYTIAISGQQSRPGTVGAPLLRKFTAVSTGKNSRLYDSEVKLLEDFALKFHNSPNVKGTLTLTSEQTFCTSCTGIIKQFKEAFPNIQLNLINGVK